MKWGPKHKLAHSTFLNLHPEFEPIEIYKACCKLLKLGDEAVERGLGKLFAEGKLKSKEKKPKRKKTPRATDDFA